MFADRYVRCLQQLIKRLPIGRDDGVENIDLLFTWSDAFKPKKITEQRSLQFERNAVLFNIASVLNQQAHYHCFHTDKGLPEAARKLQARTYQQSPCPVAYWTELETT